MSLRVVLPSAPLPTPTTRHRAPVQFAPPDAAKHLPQNYSLQAPCFIYNDTQYVLLHHLAELWNFPSSYQLLCKMLKRSGVPKTSLFRSSDPALNKLLYTHKAIKHSLLQSRLFYMELELLVQILVSDNLLFGEPAPDFSAPIHVPDVSEDDDVTVSQVFPGYDNIDEILPLTFGTFLSLNTLTKLHLYKHDGSFRKYCGNNMTAFERELLYTSNNFFSDDLTSHTTNPVLSSKKPLGRQKKVVSTIDPNKENVTENLLPGAGMIAEFNVSTICKVPNYFVTNNQMNSASQNVNPVGEHLKSLQLKPEDTEGISPQLLQMLLNTDQDAFLFKYYYFKNYRGPGSGNYKDAALVNKINRIKRFSSDTAPKSNKNTHMSLNRVTKPSIKRGDRAIKGLVHEFYNNENVELVTARQRIFTEDFTNLEMLHNNTSFNLLLNAYRNVATGTWKAYYKFKTTDFEKLYNEKKWRARQKRKMELWAKRSELNPGDAEAVELTSLLKPDLSEHFVLPTDYPEVKQKLPVELRGEDDDPELAISRPIRYTSTYADANTPELLNQIEVIKLPNPNSVGWDNLRKYAN